MPCCTVHQPGACKAAGPAQAGDVDVIAAQEGAAWADRLRRRNGFREGDAGHGLTRCHGRHQTAQKHHLAILRLGLRQLLLPVRGRLEPGRGHDRHRPVDAFQKARRIARDPARQRAAGVRPLFRQRRKPALAILRRLARDRMVQRRAQRIDVAPGSRVARSRIELVRRVAVLHHAEAGILLRLAHRTAPRRAEVDQDRLAFRGQEDVVRRDVAMQQPPPVDVPDGRNQLARDRHDLVGCQGALAFVDDLQQVVAPDMIHRHIGSIVVLEHLMHADDVRVRQQSQAPRLVQEAFHDPLHLVARAL